ncbi:MAG: ANTAR domain-containing protein [Gammaproteobacteria bacterium]
MHNSSGSEPCLEDHSLRDALHRQHHSVAGMSAPNKALRIMLVDSFPERTNTVEAALVAAGHHVVARVMAGGDLAAEVSAVLPDVIIIDIDSPNRDTLEHMRTISRDHPRPVVMFTNDDNAETIRSAVQAGVSAYVVDGLNANRVLPVLEVARARFEEFQAMREELEQTRATLADRKLVEKAKGLVMQKSGMDEATAYKAMRKMAMDRNIRIVDLARTILAATELLGEPAPEKHSSRGT